MQVPARFPSWLKSAWRRHRTAPSAWQKPWVPRHLMRPGLTPYGAEMLPSLARLEPPPVLAWHPSVAVLVALKCPRPGPRAVREAPVPPAVPAGRRSAREPAKRMLWQEQPVPRLLPGEPWTALTSAVDPDGQRGAGPLPPRRLQAGPAGQACPACSPVQLPRPAPGWASARPDQPVLMASTLPPPADDAVRFRLRAVAGCPPCADAGRMWIPRLPQWTSPQLFRRPGDQAVLDALAVGRQRRRWISSTSCGTTVNRSPTMPKSAISKIGASSFLSIATMCLAVCIPALCWIAPEMPRAM